MSEGNPLSKRLDAIATKAGVREKEVAVLVGTTPQTLHRWRSSSVAPQSAHLQRVLDLVYIATELGEIYTPEEARIWLYERHRLLSGRRPSDLISNGEIDRVLDLIAQLKDGAYV
ncbi:MAG: DUF2384 domain-containing protein [Chloroflexota bacterium]|nr:MAG: DUF2384 domain-containing protein [Chloroflexota bacterium]